MNRNAISRFRCCSYTIFAHGDELRGRYECEKGIEFAEKTQTGGAVVDRCWRKPKESNMQ